MNTRILRGDCRDILKTMENESVHCVVTSPPYFGLRDYGVARQIGLEPTPDAFVSELVAVFREVRRVLRKDGTVWLNLGDSYNAHPGQRKTTDKVGPKQETNGGSNTIGSRHVDGMKPKDLIGIPWRVAFALQADGWYLRQDIIWLKPNPMPESVRDRCTKAHEYIFLLSRSERYFYDAEAIAEETAAKYEWGAQPYKCGDLTIHHKASNSKKIDEPGTRNKRSVWEVATHPFSEAHFATFPPALIEPCIKAGCPEKACAKCGAPWVREWEKEFRGDGHTHGYADRPTVGNKMKLSGAQLAAEHAARPNTFIGFAPSCSCDAGTVNGTVLDPFGGSGTTGLVADRLGRNAILIELNPEYADMAERRIRGDAPLFAQVG